MNYSMPQRTPGLIKIIRIDRIMVMFDYHEDKTNLARTNEMRSIVRYKK